MRSQQRQGDITPAARSPRQSSAAGAVQPRAPCGAGLAAAHTGLGGTQQAVHQLFPHAMLPPPGLLAHKPASTAQATGDQAALQLRINREQSKPPTEPMLPSPAVLCQNSTAGQQPPLQPIESAYRRSFCPTPVTTGIQSQTQLQGEVALDMTTHSVAAVGGPRPLTSGSSLLTTSGGEEPGEADQLASSASCNPRDTPVLSSPANQARPAAQRERTMTQVAKAAHVSAIAAKTAAPDGRARAAAAKAALSSPRGFYEQQRGASWSMQAAGLGYQQGAPSGIPPHPAAGYQRSSLSSGLVLKVLRHVNADVKMSNSEIGEPLILRDLPYVPSRKSKARPGAQGQGVRKRDSNTVRAAQIAMPAPADASGQLDSQLRKPSLEWNLNQHTLKRQSLQQQLQMQMKEQVQQQQQQHQVHVLAHSAANLKAQAESGRGAQAPPARTSMLAGLTASVRTIAQQKAQKQRSAQLAQRR